MSTDKTTEDFSSPMKTIFFSWQSDIKTRVGRNLIEQTLEIAVSRILPADGKVEEADRADLTIDRDTKDVPGSPPITDTILKKIDSCLIFVPDLTFIATRANGEKIPNPNVLIEYGWALKSLTHSRIIPVMNAAYGAPPQNPLPFDLCYLRNPIMYNCSEDADEIVAKSGREKLASDFAVAVRAVINSGVIHVAKEGFVNTSYHSPIQGGERGRFTSPGEPLGVVTDTWKTVSENIYLKEGPIFWIRLQPRNKTPSLYSSKHLRETGAGGNNYLLLPLRISSTFTIDHVVRTNGFGVFLPIAGSNETPFITMAFETGEVWSVDAYSLSTKYGPQKIIILNEQDYGQALQSYAVFMQKLEIEPPYNVTIGVSGVKGWKLLPESSSAFGQPRPSGSCLEDVVSVTGEFTPGDGNILLEAFCSKVYQACGLERRRT